MDYANSLYLTGAELGLSVTGLVLLLVTAWSSEKSARMVTIAAAAALFGAVFFSFGLLYDSSLDPGALAFGGLYRVDDYSSAAKILVYLATIACLVVSPRFFDARGDYRGEYPVLLLFSAVGMGITVSAVDMLTLYIGIEMTSLSSYILASFARNDTRSSEAGLKYFILGALASGILLYGMSLLYGFTGTTGYSGLRTALSANFSAGAMIGLVFMLVGIAFKISAVPLHMWTPDVYEGAPTPVTTFFATAPKVASVVMLVRIALGPFADQIASWQQIVIFGALASIIWGAFGAIGQNNLKRLLAYSSINNIGFILIGLAAVSPAGAGAVLLYLLVYVAMTAGSFVGLLMLRDEEGNALETFDDITGLATSRPLLAWCLLLLMFSLAGIPPLLGFWAKLVVFQAAVQADLIVLATIGIAASVIGAFYYLKFVKVMFIDEGGERTPEQSSPAGHWAVIGVCTLIISPVGYLLTPWFGEVAEMAASSLFAAV